MANYAARALVVQRRRRAPAATGQHRAGRRRRSAVRHEPQRSVTYPARVRCRWPSAAGGRELRRGAAGGRRRGRVRSGRYRGGAAPSLRSKSLRPRRRVADPLGCDRQPGRRHPSGVADLSFRCRRDGGDGDAGRPGEQGSGDGPCAGACPRDAAAGTGPPAAHPGRVTAERRGAAALAAAAPDDPGPQVRPLHRRKRAAVLAPTTTRPPRTWPYGPSPPAPG